MAANPVKQTPPRAVGSVPIVALSALELRDRIASGELRAEQVAEAYLEQIRLREPQVQAFAWHDPAYVMYQATEADRFRGAGRPIGPLHGVPIALKDIIDTARIPTENGAALDKGRVPSKDAVIVARLKQAGAIILGKTVTTELAFLAPGVTTNPVNAAHTPGGSSQGSAAAVAAFMAPLAVGTQTGGSIIRPASFCGVVGFKPTFGAIARTGILPQSQTLDTVGVFARSAADAALLAEVLYGADAGDPQSVAGPFPRLLDLTLTPPPVAPTFAFLRPIGWDQADPQLHAAFAELTEALGERCFEIELPEDFARGNAMREVINFAEMARAYYRYGQASDLLAPETLEALKKGNATMARDYLAALDWQRVLSGGLDKVFERADVILTPAALGPASAGLASTGSAVFNGLWSLLGTPAVTVPLFESEEGLPMGVQLVAARHMDGRLLRSARWLTEWAQAPEVGN